MVTLSLTFKVVGSSMITVVDATEKADALGVEALSTVYKTPGRLAIVIVM
jgi:hypothetical protein